MKFVFENKKDYYYISCMIYFWLYKKGKGFFGLIFFKLVYRFVNSLILSVLIEIIIIDKLNLDFS